MTEQQNNFLIALVNEPAPSGYEVPIQKIWRDEVQSFCKDIQKDTHGNLIATVNRGKEKSIMIVGHSDEIGLIVHYINDNGFIYFRPVGGIEAGILASHRARIITKNGIVNGAIGKTSVHLTTREDEKKEIKFQDIWIDIGAKNKEEALKYISIGDPVVFGADYQKLTGDVAMARCWDNRVGIYIVAEVLRNLSARNDLMHTVFGVSSVQEETGVWGAGNAAYILKPTAAIALDVMPCTDSPSVSKEKFGETKLGEGPVIAKGVRTNNIISNRMIETAKKHNITHQIEVDAGNTWTDADPISAVRGGIPIGVLSVPTRYLHSSVETLSLKDVDDTVKLLTEFIIETDLNY